MEKVLHFWRLASLFMLACALPVFAADPPPRIFDEGVQQGVYFKLNCVGAGVGCTHSGSTATLTVAGGHGNGANCSANSFPLGVDENGAVESCSTSISGNSATATALAANGANCSAGSYPLGVNASGAVESCTSNTLQHVTGNGATTTNSTSFLGSVTDVTNTATSVSGFGTSSIFQVSKNFNPVGGIWTTNTYGTNFANSYGGSISGGGSVEFGALNFQTRIGGSGTLTFPVIAGIKSASAFTNNSGSMTATTWADFYSRTPTAWSFAPGVSTATRAIQFYAAPGEFPTTGNTLTTRVGFQSDDFAASGAGTFTNQYGAFFNPLTKAVNNYEAWFDGDAGLWFRESGTFINSSTAGQLDITAATSVKINTAQFKTANYSLPLADGTANQIQSTNGSGALSFTTANLQWVSDRGATTTNKLTSTVGFYMSTTGGAAARIPLDSYGFAIDFLPTTGIFFSNTRQAIEFHLVGTAYHSFYLGALSVGAVYFVPRTTAPSGGVHPLDGSMYVHDDGAGLFTLKIYDGTSWVNVGSQ